MLKCGMGPSHKDNNLSWQGSPSFATTQWSVVLAAGAEATQASQAALDLLCQTYWYPLYAYVRRSGYSAHDAQDLTQAFFVRLLEKQYLALADRNRGRFRSFLLISLKRFLINEREKSQTIRKGGGHIHFSIDAEGAEARYGAEPVDDLTPNRLFEKRWATTVLERALEILRQEYEKAGTQRLFERLKEHLWGNQTVTYADIARDFGMKEGSVRAAVFRLRKRFGETVRGLIAETVATPDQIEEEVNDLLSAFQH